MIYTKPKGMDRQTWRAIIPHIAKSERRDPPATIVIMEGDKRFTTPKPNDKI